MMVSQRLESPYKANSGVGLIWRFQKLDEVAPITITFPNHVLKGVGIFNAFEIGLYIRVKPIACHEPNAIRSSRDFDIFGSVIP